MALCGDIYQQIRYVIGQLTTYVLILSIVGSFLTILTFVLFRQIRTHSIKIILYLCICIMFGYTFVNISNVWWITDVYPLCIIVAFLSHYFLLADFCWTFCIAFNFYQMIVKRNREVVLLEKWYHLGAWGLPAVIVIIVGALKKYGRIPAGTCTTAACYITDQYVTFGAFFVPGIIIITINVILFFLIGREIQETLAGAPKTDQRDRKQEFRVYLSIFIVIGVSWIFGYIEASIPEKVTQTIFYIIFSLTTPGQGILIFLTHCLNAKVMGKWTKFFGRLPCCPCCNSLHDRIQSSNSSTAASRSAQSRSAHSASASRG